MTTGPIYLVSACASGEEFVAAFRRYADRNGVFVPIGEPIPVGKRGRFAVTLRDGGVMIEGDGQVISSAKTPSVLHGRVGMTIRFTELDEPSKTVLVELEKARLAMKPQAPSVPPRPADVPPAPRAVPPAPGGRVDASTALAQCVAIGDVGALATVDPKPAAPKFVVPAIPPVGQRPKPPSRPPLPELPPRTPPAAERAAEVETPVPQVDDPLPARPGALSATLTAVKPAPGAFSETMPAIQISGLRPPTEDPEELTAPHDPLPPADPPAEPLPPADPPAEPPPPAKARPPVEALPPAEIISRPPREDPTTPMPPMRETPPPRATTPAGLPIVQPPVLPDEVPATLANAPEVDEPTDLTEIPIHDEPRPQRTTTIGVAVGARVLPAVVEPAPARDEPELAAGVAVPPRPEPAAPDGAGPQPRALAASPRTPAVEEPTPSGDWTIKPGDAAPTIEPRARRVKEPSGDWTISLTGDAGAAFAEAVPAPEPVAHEPPIETAGEAPVEAAGEAGAPEAPVPEPAVDEPKVQVDPTLIEPLVAMPVEPPVVAPVGAPVVASVVASIEPPVRPTPVPNPAPPMPTPPPAHAVAFGPPIATHEVPSIVPGAPVPGAPVPGAPVHAHPGYPQMYTPPPGALQPHAPATIGNATSPTLAYESAQHGGPPPRGVTDGGTGFFRESGELAHIGDSTSLVPAPRSRRVLVIAISAALVVALGIVLVVVLTRGDGAPVAADSSQTASTDVPDASAGRAVAPPPADAAAEEPPPIDAAEVAAVECFVEVASTPSGAEIVHARKVIGKTPERLSLPCGESIRLTLRKARLASVTRKVVPTEEGTKLRVRLPRRVFKVKVSSQPAGATVKLGSKTLGVTPTTVRLPAFASSTLTISKSGYVPAKRRITPRKNNQAIQARLTRKRRSR